MTESTSYGQFCPVSMASEVICSRWTPLIIRELLCGSTRFNDLKRGMPRISPTLLSKRLKELEVARIIKIHKQKNGIKEYVLTESGEGLRPIIMGLGAWGHEWISSGLSLRNLDPSLLMWDMRRNIRTEPMPGNRCTIHFMYPELTQKKQNWWMVVDDNVVDVCDFDPGYEVDLMLVTSLLEMTSIWMGYSDVKNGLATGRLVIDGDPQLKKSLQTWLGLSVFAGGVV